MDCLTLFWFGQIEDLSGLLEIPALNIGAGRFQPVLCAMLFVHIRKVQVFPGGFNMAAGAILDITGTNTGLIGYTLQNIVIAPVNFNGITAASGDALLITVTVTGPDGMPVVMEGIRTRYSPRAVP